MTDAGLGSVLFLDSMNLCNRKCEFRTLSLVVVALCTSVAFLTSSALADSPSREGGGNVYKHSEPERTSDVYPVSTGLPPRPVSRSHSPSVSYVAEATAPAVDELLTSGKLSFEDSRKLVSYMGSGKGFQTVPADAGSDSNTRRIAGYMVCDSDKQENVSQVSWANCRVVAQRPDGMACDAVSSTTDAGSKSAADPKKPNRR